MLLLCMSVIVPSGAPVLPDMAKILEPEGTED